MEFTAPRIRVAAYVIRHRHCQPELLIFDHVDMPEAGTQVPAGGVSHGETLQDAVLRKILEETGIADVRIVTAVGVEDKPHPRTGAPRRTTFIHAEAGPDSADGWRHHVHGDGEDTGMEFDCWFQPLPLPARLADHQDVFLNRIEPNWAAPQDRAQ
ncbi:hypothetical protein Lfu02_76040 [Longispora fulva]|uniref:ADP-ribose pyrophosphatase YjhB (NUDIX family) n=1 Tax=Longispora fulva TaxID=619741 RepID=A0A8J7GSJ8_9ACTN|nr:NUDIX domain-containing protein [Longispora fulva]MBG6136261.1 ADP-ribose pyrophosphatase YjhB (NUDIX family) [Longispora fulva]GIG63232.1 hypothetical protein Lfu02_76040 [Longispora fulva]